MRHRRLSLPARHVTTTDVWAVLAISALLATCLMVARPAAVATAAVPTIGRLADTRHGASTIDGQVAGTGALTGGAVLELPVAGRAGVPGDASAAVVNLTAVHAVEPGHIIVFPCGTEPPVTSNLNYVPSTVSASLAVASLDEDGDACMFVSGTTDLVVDVALGLSPGEFDALPAPGRLVDTRSGADTVDGSLSGIGLIDSGATLTIPTADRVSLGDGPAVVSVTAVDAATPGFFTAHTCGAPPEHASTVNFLPGDTIANAAVVEPDADGAICVTAIGTAHLIVDVTGTLSAAALLASPQRLVDTRPSGGTVDGADSGIGTRPAGGTLSVQVAGRGDVPADAAVAILNVTVADARAVGFVTAHVGERPNASNVNYGPGDTVANAVVAPLDADGGMCLFTLGATDLVVDVVGWMPAAAGSPETADCPAAEPLFPNRRIVALYGNDTAAALGVLGEQPPDEAADRLAEIAQPFGAGDRPVQGAFELIATIALSFPGDGGLYRSVSSADDVQRYLDVATERGLLLILDIQPGQSDFLTEVQRYEQFLREPNVHVALDPEWHMQPGQVPGETVGQVDAAEVNEVSDYLAAIVAEEGLPEKMLVVHQFQERMLTNRQVLREPAGIALVIHMDGFGTQQQKLSTYDVVEAEPPFSNGFKLFFDEDIDMFQPAQVLALDPVPDLITYQ